MTSAAVGDALGLIILALNVYAIVKIFGLEAGGLEYAVDTCVLFLPVHGLIRALSLLPQLSCIGGTTASRLGSMRAMHCRA